MSEQLERMASKFGGSVGKAPKYIVPLIRFDGTRGEYRKISMEDGQKVETPLKKGVKLVILKKRRVLSSFSPSGSLFSTEHNTINDEMSVFSVVAGQVKFEMTGRAPEIRQKFQTIKTHEIIYGMLGTGEIVKLEIKGGSLGNYYDYQRKLKTNEVHSFQVVTALGSEAAKNEAQFAYFRMTFKDEELPEKISLDTIEEKMNEVDAELAKIDDYFAKRNQQDKNASQERKEHFNEPKEPTADEVFDSLGNDEPNPDDIPF